MKLNGSSAQNSIIRLVMPTAKKKNTNIRRIAHPSVSYYCFCLNFVLFVFATAIVFVWLASKGFGSRNFGGSGQGVFMSLRSDTIRNANGCLSDWLWLDLEGRVADEGRSNNRDALLGRTNRRLFGAGVPNFWVPTLIAPEWPQF